MKNVMKLMVAVVTIAFMSAAFTNGLVESYTVDTAKSKLEWNASKVTGKHNGEVMLKSGSLEMTDGTLTGGEFVIDMTSISVLDLDGNMKDKLTGHLNSPDFFNTAEFPEASFKINSVVSRGTPGDYTIKGDLTVKGITKPTRFIANVAEEGGMITATAEEIIIDRAEYNVRYGSGSFFDNLGDKTIYDEFTIGVTLVAKK